jgi:uncharacterized protein (DUF885 family)
MHPTVIRPALLPVLLLAFAGCAVHPAPATPMADASAPVFQRLLEDDWEHRMRESPLFATSVGDRRFNDRLGEVGLAAQQRRLAANRDFLARLRAIDREALPLEERVHYDVFALEKEHAIREAELGGHVFAITNRGGFHISFPELHDRVPLRTVQDYENYLARLNDFPRFTREHVELLREGIRRGWTLPRVVMEDADVPIRAQIVEDPEASTLFIPFRDFPDAVPAGERARLREAGRRAIADAVVPAYREFLAFIEGEYLPDARADIATLSIPDGEAYYAHRVQLFTTLPLSAREVHEIGLAEVARIRAEMEDVIARAGFEGGFDEWLHFLRTDPRFYAETPEALMKEVAHVLKRMDGELPRLFGRLPRMPYGIREIPAHIAPRTTTAYYTRPRGDGTQAGFYWVNTYGLSSRPLYEVEALSLHEAVPGHHLQIALQQELEGLPMFRRFSGFTAFTEGWALYSERLGLEVGFYEDPYSDFGRLTYEMWRACRLVVDTGMHALGWTRQQAIDFMAANTALTLLNIRNEVDRYIAWPGQALAYKIGELKISELRAEAEAAHGDRFDVRAFHDVVLGSGALPLPVLETVVRRWIAEVVAEHPPA